MGAVSLTGIRPDTVRSADQNALDHANGNNGSAAQNLGAFALEPSGSAAFSDAMDRFTDREHLLLAIGRNEWVAHDLALLLSSDGFVGSNCGASADFVFRTPQRRAD